MANEKIVDTLNRAFRGEAWHGPSLMEALLGVDAKGAARRKGDAHSIWELVLHVTVWKRAVLRRLNGETVQPSPEDDFPSADQSAELWSTALEELKGSHEALVMAVATLSAERLHAQTPGKEYDNEFMVLGTAQHDCYHGGQISLLKKL